mmetsp:Transcript_16513/g.30052  ORF Transcript_16513/g.30052 Transcript_16513/m.30052 type:complete len:791 (-) Transcript_16513:97-2469(-)
MDTIQVSEEEARARLEMIRRLVAQPIPASSEWTDPDPAVLDGYGILIGNKYHAANVDKLLDLGVTAVLNCASGGISCVPVDKLKERGIRYAFTNVREDNFTYPILHDKNGKCSNHLEIAKALYDDEVVQPDNDGTNKKKGKVLFFCVAGQNRSATLAIAVLMLFGHGLEDILEICSKNRNFIVENTGFQQQLVELEVRLAAIGEKRRFDTTKIKKYSYGTLPPASPTKKQKSQILLEKNMLEVEILIPGLYTMEVQIPTESTIATVKQCLIDHANKHLLSYSDPPAKVAKAWVVLAMFGFDDMYDVPLEVEAMELSVQLNRIQKMFDLKVIHKGTEKLVQWNDKCRFALVIFSVNKTIKYGSYKTKTIQEPWKFVHEERPGAPSTLLENVLMSTHLRAWDFVTGQAFCSNEPIVFSFADDPRDKRDFMKISKSSNTAQQFQAPGEGGILGMGANAIVHRVQLKPTSIVPDNEDQDIESSSQESLGNEGWDAAVKRPFSLSKMLASLKNSSEFGLAKRLRVANSLNSDGRVLYFYGLGVGLAANALNQTEYKFEAQLLARYEEEFSSYTMRRFMEDFVSMAESAPSSEERAEIEQLQTNFSLISVKVLLVSLLNGFRDLTLMGIHAFDFNHLNNVLVSRDHRTVRLIDIDGNSKGSIQYPSEYIGGVPSDDPEDMQMPHKPSLDIDLNTVLPRVVQQLILGKARGPGFVTNTVSEIWRAKTEDAKIIIQNVVRENFFSDTIGRVEDSNDTDKLISKVSEWFYAMLKKQSPWENWTNDIYDAMRCFDHLPIT